MKFKYQPNPKPPKYLYIGANPNPKHRLFVLLCALGYSQGEAYQIAISPKAKASSASVAGCNLMKQRDVQKIAHHLAQAHLNGEWDLQFDMLRPDVLEY